jgi:hypothetical protein
MDRVNALKQRGAEAVADSSPRPGEASLSLVSVGVQTDIIGAPTISPAQMLMDLRRPRLGLDGSAMTQRETMDVSDRIEAEARRRGNIVRRAAEIHSCPRDSTAGNVVVSLDTSQKIAAESDTCGIVQQTSEAHAYASCTEQGTSNERIEQQAVFLDGFGDPSEIDMIHSAAIFQADNEEVDLLLEKDISEEDDTASVCSSRSLPRWEEVVQERQQLGIVSGQADLSLNTLGTSGSKAALLGSSASGGRNSDTDQKREAARLSALQFVSEQQHATVRVAKEKEAPAQASGASTAQSTGLGSGKSAGTGSKKLLHATGSKVKRGVMGFFRELKDELVAERD